MSRASRTPGQWPWRSSRLSWASSSRSGGAMSFGSEVRLAELAAMRSLDLDAVGRFGQVVVDRPRLLFREQSFLEPSLRFLWHGRRSQDGPGTTRIVDVVGFQEESRPAFQRLRREFFLRQDRWHESWGVLRSGEGRRVMLHDVLGGEPR